MMSSLIRNISMKLMYILPKVHMGGNRVPDDRGVFAAIFSWAPHDATAKRPTAWIDGLRGVAAFEVFIFHYSDLWISGDPGYGSGPEYMQLYRLPILRTFWNSGRCMVCTFFIISGYVLSQRSLLAIRKQRTEAVLQNTSSAIFRRGIRLFPPALIICVIGFVLVRLGFRGSKDDKYLPYFDSFWEQLWHFVAETFRFLSFFTWAPRTNGGLMMHKYEAVVWSIPMEFIGSMAIYVIIVGTAHLSSTRRNACIAGCALFGLSMGCWTIFCFYSGILAADLQLVENLIQKRYFHKVPQSLRTIFFTCMLAQGFLMAGAPQRGFLEEGETALGFNTQWKLIPERVLALDVNYTGWSLAGLLMFCSIPHLHYARKFLETQFCQYLGQISFALYLNHVWTRDILGSWLRALLEGLLGAEGPGLYLASVIWWCVMTALNLIVAGVFERLVDRPTVRFAKDLEASCVADAHDRQRDRRALGRDDAAPEGSGRLASVQDGADLALEAGTLPEAAQEKSST